MIKNIILFMMRMCYGINSEKDVWKKIIFILGCYNIVIDSS